MAYIDNVKQWFSTGLKPTEIQFYAKFAWLRWKDEAVPVEDVSGLAEILNNKAEEAVLTHHLTDANAHHTLERKAEKGVANGYAPLNELGKLLTIYLNTVNDLATGGTDAVLTAEQGKQLQLQINAINTLLSSDNVDLDNVQELVDAIETLQTSLETILVNDLTTGGVTKALTAEMGKLLNANKAEKGGYTGSLQDLKDELTEEINDRTLAIADANARMDGIDDDFDMYQLINNQIYVSASGTVQDSWHGKLVTFTASVTITVPATGLRTGFNFEGIVDQSCTVTTAITAPKAWYGGYAGAAIPENSIFTFLQRSNDSNKISIYGL